MKLGLFMGIIMALTSKSWKLISRTMVYSGHIWLYYEYVSHLRWFRCTPPKYPILQNATPLNMPWAGPNHQRLWWRGIASSIHTTPYCLGCPQHVLPNGGQLWARQWQIMRKCDTSTLNHGAISFLLFFLIYTIGSIWCLIIRYMMLKVIPKWWPHTKPI